MVKERVNFLLNVIPKHKDANVRDCNMVERVARTCDMIGNYNPSYCDGIHLSKWDEKLFSEGK